MPTFFASFDVKQQITLQFIIKTQKMFIHKPKSIQQHQNTRRFCQHYVGETY